MTRIVIIVLSISLILGIIFWKVAPNFTNRSNSQGPITLNVWGLWDDAYLKDVIAQYQKDNPNITIAYKKQNPTNYRTRVQTQISYNQGPDIFAIHNTWITTFLKTNSLSSAPSSTMNIKDFQGTFYPVAKDTLTAGNNIYALPLEIDGLGMYVNTDILSAAGVSIPADWFAFVDAVNKVKVIDSAGNIKTAGAALGSTNNVDYSSDILGLLFFQQPQADLTNPASDAGVQVLKFYTSFITDPRRKTWDVTMESSTQAFEAGKLAFYFGPASQANVIKAASPNLHFQVAPTPQLPGNPRAAWASFWALGVASNSQYQDESWNFIKYLTSSNVEQYLFQQQQKNNLYGEPYSRVDLQSTLASDPVMGAFVTQGAYYKSWYLASGTGDNGVDDEMIKAYSDSIDGIIQTNADPLSALQTTSKGVQSALAKYVKPNPPPSPQ